jgi:hypothetical protein
MHECFGYHPAGCDQYRDRRDNLNYCAEATAESDGSLAGIGTIETTFTDFCKNQFVLLPMLFNTNPVFMAQCDTSGRIHIQLDNPNMRCLRLDENLVSHDCGVAGVCNCTCTETRRTRRTYHNMATFALACDSQADDECMSVLDRTQAPWNGDANGITTDWDQQTNTLSVLNDVSNRWAVGKKSLVPLVMAYSRDFSDVIGAEFVVTATFTGNASISQRATVPDLNTILKANPPLPSAIAANSNGMYGCAAGATSSSLQDAVDAATSAGAQFTYEINPGNRLYAVVIDETNTVHWASNVLDIPVSNGPTTPMEPYTHRQYPVDTNYTFRFLFDDVEDMQQQEFNSTVFDFQLGYNGGGPCKETYQKNGSDAANKISRRYFSETQYPLELDHNLNLFGTPTWGYGQTMNRTAGAMRFGIVGHFIRKTTPKWMNMGNTIVGGITYTFKTKLLYATTTSTTTPNTQPNFSTLAPPVLMVPLVARFFATNVSSSACVGSRAFSSAAYWCMHGLNVVQVILLTVLCGSLVAAAIFCWCRSNRLRSLAAVSNT